MFLFKTLSRLSLTRIGHKTSDKKKPISFFEGKKPDFGKTAQDYAKHRRGFPDKFFMHLQNTGLAKPGLKALDLGTGTGTVARGLAKLGCDVIGIDPAEELLKKAAKLDQEEGVKVKYIVATAEKTTLPDNFFDLIVAGQCWHWFAYEAAIKEVKRIIKPDGKLVIAHFDWLPLKNSVPELTEKLILKYNPKWKMSGGTGYYPQWATQLAEANFRNIETYTFDEGVLYTHEDWRGRIRASAGISASLSPEEVEKFDAEHKEELERKFPQTILNILHRCFILRSDPPRPLLRLIETACKLNEKKNHLEKSAHKEIDEDSFSNTHTFR